MTTIPETAAETTLPFTPLDEAAVNRWSPPITVTDPEGAVLTIRPRGEGWCLKVAYVQEHASIDLSTPALQDLGAAIARLTALPMPTSAVI